MRPEKGNSPGEVFVPFIIWRKNAKYIYLISIWYLASFTDSGIFWGLPQESRDWHIDSLQQSACLSLLQINPFNSFVISLFFVLLYSPIRSLKYAHTDLWTHSKFCGHFWKVSSKFRLPSETAKSEMSKKVIPILVTIVQARVKLVSRYLGWTILITQTVKPVSCEVVLVLFISSIIYFWLRQEP